MVTGHRDSQVDRASGLVHAVPLPCPLSPVYWAADPEVWGGTGEDRGGWGGSAYRGGAGGENVITRSSLLKVRHRLVGTEFMGGGGHSEPGLGWGQEATPECPTEQHQEPLAPGRGGHRQTQH